MTQIIVDRDRSLALFAACFVLSYVVCALSAGSLEFWHVWGWFVS